MSEESLFHIEMIDGAVKVSPSEELVSLPIDRQIAKLQNKLRACEDELNAMENNGEGQSDDKDLNAARCELELTMVILKNFLKQFEGTNWVRINE